MDSHVCSIASAYFHDVLAVSDDSKIQLQARDGSAHSHAVGAQCKRCLEEKEWKETRPILQGIVPDQMLESVASSDNATKSAADLAQFTLDTKQKLQNNSLAPSTTVTNVFSSSKLNRQIYDMQHVTKLSGRNDETLSLLPGKLVRSEGEPPIADQHANQAYDNCAKVLDFFHQVFDYNFLDDHSAPLISSIHFENGYQNAQWVSSPVKQMIYGDGGHKLHNFTACLDIIGHEMTHAISEHVCCLYYDGESGALNEHISDVFGIMVMLWDEKKTSADSKWLIGENCLMPDLKGVALRNMKFPGTAYDDPEFGKDPQVGSMTEIEVYKAKHKYWATYDHGCVHVFSGVPNRAFVLASETLGGYCWEKTGKIWWKTLSTRAVPTVCTFLQFANATVEMARNLFDEEVAGAVRSAWEVVGVLKPISA